MFLETDSFSVGQCEQTVVVHHTVHVLYPQCIHIAVKHDVFPLIFVSRLQTNVKIA